MLILADTDSCLLFGSTEIVTGSTIATGGAIVTVGSAGALSVAGVPAAAGGAAITTHGVSVAGVSAYNFIESTNRSGKPFTPKGKKEVIEVNKAKNSGQTICENCGVQTLPGQKSQKGVTPPGNETNVDHIIPKSKGGEGGPSNGQVLCRDCNIEKGDN